MSVASLLAAPRYALVSFEILRGEKHLVGNSEIKSIVNGVGFSLLPSWK